MTAKKKPKKRKKTGRKQSYRKSYCQRLVNFFSQEPYEDIELDHFDKEGNITWTDIKRMPNKLPTLIDFARSIKISTVTIYKWINPDSTTYHEEFLNAFTHAQEIRKWFLVQNGLQGLYNPLFAKFTAVNITDMRDKKEQKVDVEGKLHTLLEMINGSTIGKLPDKSEKDRARKD